MTTIAPPGAPEAPRATPPAAASAAGGRWAGAAAPAPPGSGAAAATLAPNPALRMDAELGLVVLEFRDSRGELAASLPTSRELDAYRRAARTGAPPTGAATADPAGAVAGARPTGTAPPQQQQQAQTKGAAPPGRA